MVAIITVLPVLTTQRKAVCSAAHRAWTTLPTEFSTLTADGFGDYTYWTNIANKYGYDTDDVQIGTLTDVYNGLKAGYPAIAHINTGEKTHWVVVYKYSGTGKV